MKKFLVGVAITILGMVSAHAGEFNNAVIEASEKISSSGQKTVVLFHTDKSPKVVLSQVRMPCRSETQTHFFIPIG